jgi:hypothetical protein
VVNNTLAVIVPRTPALGELVARDSGHVARFWLLIAATTLAALPLLYGFHRLRWQRSEEEEHREAILKAIQSDG